MLSIAWKSVHSCILHLPQNVNRSVGSCFAKVDRAGFMAPQKAAHAQGRTPPLHTRERNRQKVESALQERQETHETGTRWKMMEVSN